jgi:hypothetical protein
MGKLFACAAVLGTGAVVGALVCVELAAVETEDVAADVELTRSKDEVDDVDTDTESTLSTR